MAYFLLPVSLFIKQLIPDVYVYYIAQMPLYVYLIMLIICLSFKLRKHQELDYRSMFNKRVLICTAIVLLFQLIAMFVSHYTMSNSGFDKDPLREFIKLLITIMCITIHYFVVRETVNNKIHITQFIKGNGIALFILLIICYIQFFYLLFPNVFGDLTNFIGYLEYRFDRDWYDQGSYVQTLQRINGINPEPSYLAAQLLIVFVPFIIASIKNKVNIFSKHQYKSIYYYVLLLSIIFILFFAKTTTGLLAILLILCSLWLLLPRKQKYIWLALLPVCAAGAFLIYWYNPLIRTIIDATLMDKLGGDSFINRAGGTIGLIVTWLQHPFIGIGLNYHNYYLFKNVPLWATSNFEFTTVFEPQNYYPILSVFFGWLAEIGTIFVLFISVYTLKLLRDFRTLSKNAVASSADAKFICTISDAAHFFFFYYFVCSLVNFNWYESIYLIMIFFFVTMRQYFQPEYGALKHKL